MSSHITLADLKDEAASRFVATPTMIRVCQALLVVGVLCFIGALVVDPARAWSNWLVGAFYFTTIVLGAFFVLAVTNLTSGAWHVTSKRVFEALSAWLPIGLGTMLVLLGGIGVIYEWTHHHDDGSMHSHLLEHKAPWLNIPFFAARIVAYFGIWYLATRAMVKASRQQDHSGDIVHVNRQRKFSAIYLVTLAPTITLASMDWVMSLDATWFSTMFGVYHFSGAWQASLAMIILLVVILRRMGWLKQSVTDNHFHSLGQWLFASTVFWAYIWFFQWMLIWYANIPEETQYFLKRSQGSWWHVSYVVNPLLNFVLPFFLLLPRKSKRSESMLLRVAVVVLAGRWVDVWVGVLPAASEDLAFGLFEIGIFAGFVGGFGWVILRELGKASLVPLEDPFLEESLNQHT